MSDENGLALVERPLDSRIAVLRERLRLARARTRGTVDALRGEIAEQADWHTWFRAHPAVFLTAAFFTGFMLAKRR